MKVILFGATGMVGQGVLRECLLDPDVTQVVAIGRSPTGKNDPKLVEHAIPDLFDLSVVAAGLTAFDACFFCLGVSAVGMTEAAYRHITYDLTTSVARTLCTQNPSMTFIYVTGAGTDSTETQGAMWARVKGQTENALLKLPFKAAYMFRPGIILPRHGIVSKTRVYRLAYLTFGWLFWLLRALSPRLITTTELVGKAMLKVAKDGAPKTHLENPDISALAVAPQP